MQNQNVPQTFHVVQEENRFGFGSSGNQLAIVWWCEGLPSLLPVCRTERRLQSHCVQLAWVG